MKMFSPRNGSLLGVLILSVAMAGIPKAQAQQRGANLQRLLDDIDFRARGFIPTGDGIEARPILVAPRTRVRADVLKEHHAWYGRVLLAPFKLRAAGAPWETAAVEFANRAVDDLFMVFPNGSAELKTLLDAGRKAVGAGCDDLLVSYLVERLENRADPNSADYRRDLGKLFEKNSSRAGMGSALLSLVGKDLAALAGAKNPDVKVDQKVLGLLKEALGDGSYGKEDGAIFLDHQFNHSWREFHERQPEALRSTYEGAPFAPWAMHTLAGLVEFRLGWLARGTGYADKVTQEGWTDFAGHLGKARSEFLTAWKLKPDQPEAAAEMISVVNGGGAEPGETTRLWFDRATAAQFDYLPAYRRMAWALRPRWGGSVGQMFAFGKACAQTGRYDTEVPLQLYAFCMDILEEVPDWRPFFRRPEVAIPLVSLSKALLAEPSRAQEKERRTSLLGVYAWLCGDYLLAEDTLVSILNLDRSADALLDKVAVSEGMMRAEVLVCASPARGHFESAQRAYEAGNLKVAGAEFAVASQVGSPKAQKFLASRLAVVETEQALAEGQWVKLSPKPELLEWTSQLGDWRTDETGALINNGSGGGGSIYHQARVGAEFEMRAAFEVTDNPKSYRSCGIGFGFHPEDAKRWMLCQVGQRGEAGFAHLLSRYYASGVAQKAIRLPLKNQLFVRVSGGKVTFECNGERVYDAVEPGRYGTGPADGRVGFGSYKFSEGNETRITNIEVRRLKSP